jgi:diacylglycerol kinase
MARPSAARRVWRSFGFAWAGLSAVLRTQPNIWIHLAAAALALGLGVVLRLPAVELAVLVLTCAFVLSIEAINTALETLCDLVSPTYHPLIKRAKDISAAAVLIAATAAVLVACLLFGPRLVAVVR